MAEWIPPKTNWQAGDIPGAGDFNRAEGNSAYLKTQTDGLKNGSIKAAKAVQADSAGSAASAGNAGRLGGQLPSYYASVVTGIYEGDGRVSREIALGFTPKAVIIYHHGTGVRTWLAIPEAEYQGVGIVTNGFRVSYHVTDSHYSNIDGAKYSYLAFR